MHPDDTPTPRKTTRRDDVEGVQPYLFECRDCTSQKGVYLGLQPLHHGTALACADCGALYSVELVRVGKVELLPEGVEHG